MGNSENVGVLTGRGFRTTLEASAVIKAIEKSDLDPTVKAATIGVAISSTMDGMLKIADFIAKIKELFHEDPETYNLVVNIIILIQQ